MKRDLVMYLDIDGVLNSTTDHFEYKMLRDSNTDVVEPEWFMRFNHGDWVNRDRLKLIQDLAKKHDIKFVIVSAWCGGGTDYRDVHAFLELPIHSKAYNTGGGLSRGEGVQQHVEDHNIDLDDYIILDDSWREMYDDRRRCVPVDGYHGIDDVTIDMIELFYELGD